MTWVRLDEEFADHPKVVQVGPMAMAVHVSALCYCNRYLTDGFIPSAKARILFDVPDVDTEIKRLVTANLWEQIDGGYQVHDYLDYQPSKQTVLETRSKKQAAGQAGGQARAQATAKADAQAKSKPVPGPVPVPGSKTVPPKSSSPPDDAFAKFWDLYPRRDGKKLEKGKAEKSWSRLSVAEKELVMKAVVHYRDACDSDITKAKDAFRWLNAKAFMDWRTPAEPRRRGGSVDDEPVYQPL